MIVSIECLTISFWSIRTPYITHSIAVLMADLCPLIADHVAVPRMSRSWKVNRPAGVALLQ